MTSLLLALVLSLLGLAPAFGSENMPWITKEFTEWTLQDAEQILWNSPWVETRRFRFFNARRRILQITYCVRLQSARPVRLALAKAFLSQPENYVVSVDRTNPQQMQELSERFKLPDELVLSLIMTPQFVHRHLNNHSFETLGKTSYLQYGGQKMGLKGFVPPEKTTFGEAWFRFPRPEINSSSSKIRFVTSLEVPYRVSIKVEFDTSELKFLGQLEY
jgi:hypothetical protein